MIFSSFVPSNTSRLSQSSGLTLRLEQAKDVVLADYVWVRIRALGYMIVSCPTWALDVADNASGCVVHELDADLGDTTTRTCAESECHPSPNSMRHLFSLTGTTEDTGDLDELHGNPARKSVHATLVEQHSNVLGGLHFDEM